MLEFEIGDDSVLAGKPIRESMQSLPEDIVIGETTLKFVPLCGPQFSWADETQGGQAHASLG